MAKTTNTALHYIDRCQYGFLHSSNGKMEEDAIVREVTCDNPTHIPGDRKEKINKRLVEYRLRTAGNALRAAEEAYQKQWDEVREAVKAANKAGYSKTAIAVTLGLTRHNVHTILEEGK